MTPVKVVLVALSAVAVVLGILAYLYWPDDSYDTGYGIGYEQAWSIWMLTMPPPQVCQQVADEVLVSQPHFNRQRILDGCRSGYYDGVNYRRNQLGWGPL